MLFLRTLFGFFMIARGTIGGALDGDVNFKIGILMMSMFFGGFIGSNLAGLLIDRYRKFKIIGIGAISTGKIIKTQFFHGIQLMTRIQWIDTRIVDKPVQ